MEDAFLRGLPNCDSSSRNKIVAPQFKGRVNKFFLATTLVLASSSALLAPVSASQSASLPTEVRAKLPRGATSFLCERLPIGPQGTKMLVHVWGAVRSAQPRGYSPYLDSPFCVDVFEPVQRSKGRWGWHLVSSAAYTDSTQPRAVVPHWLRPAKKQGPVLEIISGNGAPGVSTYHTLLAWNEGFREGYSAPVPQEFSSGGSGGGLISQKFDQLDSRGYMTIVTENSFGNRILDVTTYGWNGSRFVTTSTKSWDVNGKPKPPGASEE